MTESVTVEPEVGRDFRPVNLFEMGFDLAARHPTRIQRDDFIVEAVEAGLTFLDELRREAGVAVSRHLNLELAALATDGFRRLAVAGIAGVSAGGVMLFVAKMVGHLALQRPLHHCLSQLVEETIIAEHVCGRLIILE